MPDKLTYVSDGKLYIVSDGTEKPVYCQSIEKYKQNAREIEKRNEWKQKSSPPLFLPFGSPPPAAQAFVSDAKFYKDGAALYSFVSAERSGFYITDASGASETERHIVSSNDYKITRFDYNSETDAIIASIKNGTYTYNLALFNADSTDYQLLTEGDCQDANPSFSKTEANTVYYDSCGLGLDQNGNFVEFGDRSICKLNYRTGDIEEIAAQKGYDCYKPKHRENGNLYYIKKPRQNNTKSMGFVDFLLIPFKILKALFGWLDFFTKRYAGEALKKDQLNTAGANPAKMQEKTQEELFIEGNLINVEKTLKENAAADGKYAGIAPRSWELVKQDENGGTVTIKKGVLDYTITADGTIIYSNGKYLKKITPSGEEAIIPANMAVNLSYSETRD